MDTTTEKPADTSASEIQRVFESQKANQLKIGKTTAKERRAKLKKLLRAIQKFRPQIKEAMFRDYRKHPTEVDLTEVYPITSEIKHARSNLHNWMGKHRVSTPIALFGSSSYVRYEPKGVSLIISPWNFPFNLTFGPLVSAIAAGNPVIIKPSEMTPHSSALMKKMVEDTFHENEVAVIEGGKDTATELLSLKFNHIFFTGSPAIGKVVMEAAAQNLTSVTLELGGKSPTIIDRSANLKMAARRVAWSKFLNNGQICIAPDYVLVHESLKSKFINQVKNYVAEFYSEHPSESASYARMVNKSHFERVKSYLDDAISKGAKIELGGEFDDSQNYISPTLVSDVPNQSELMTNEIFGPLMPVLTFRELDEAIAEINSREKPLALYIYSKSNRNIDYILNNTRAGGGCINHSSVHFYNPNLPFGGSNNSGIGKGHGEEGFRAFSNARGILRQRFPNALEFLSPPYTKFSQKLIDFTIKWF
ncbi:aldehyde dehydrogenase family protein [Halocola ammonii]